MEAIEAALITAIDELLMTEPTGDEGLCPWCGAFRGLWMGPSRADHGAECPWARLGRAFHEWVAD